MSCADVMYQPYSPYFPYHQRSQVAVSAGAVGPLTPVPSQATADYRVSRTLLLVFAQILLRSFTQFTIANSKPKILQWQGNSAEIQRMTANTLQRFRSLIAKSFNPLTLSRTKFTRNLQISVCILCMKKASHKFI